MKIIYFLTCGFFLFPVAPRHPQSGAPSGSYCMFSINGSAREMTVSPQAKDTVMLSQIVTEECPRGDSLLLGYGFKFHRKAAGKIKESLSVFFYSAAHRDNLALKNGNYTYTHTQLKQFLHQPRAWKYLREIQCAPVAGVTVAYYDAEQTMWRSYQLEPEMPITQRGASFKIKAVRSVYDAAFGWSEELEGTFHCTLYNHHGDSLVLTNGAFKGLIANAP